MTACIVAVFGFLVAATLPACSTAGGEGAGASTTTPAAPDPAAADEPDAGSDGSTPAACSSATCGSGCCAGGACKTASASSCGTAGSACVDCKTSSEGHACLYGSCGCATSSDCADGEVCDPSARRCGKSCKTHSCTSGCCSSEGVCLAGKDPNACGTSGACISCKGATNGAACVAGGACGCSTAADCAYSNQACDVTTHTCTSACSATQPCKTGCCENGTCGGHTMSSPRQEWSIASRIQGRRTRA